MMMRFDDRPIEDIHSSMQDNRHNMVERMDNMHNNIMKNFGKFNFRHFQSIVDWLTLLTILNLDFILL